MDENPKSYLIKRSNSFRDLKKNNSKKKGYFEITISKYKRNPPSHKLKIHDIIYVAETNGGIYAKGEVIETLPVKEFSTIEKLLDYTKENKDDSYWLDKIRLFRDKLSSDSNYKLRCHKYFINQKLLKRTIPYNGPLNEFDASINRGLASIFFELKDTHIKYLEKPDYSLEQIKKLDSKIPGDLRLKIYSFFNQNYSLGHLIDIDHFVPKSLGGPGNILENLVPVGFSLNRYKGNSVPLGLFEVAKKFPDLNKYVRDNKDNKMFLTSNRHKDSGRKIISLVNAWEDIKKIRAFYKAVLKFHNQDYVKLLNEIK